MKSLQILKEITLTAEQADLCRTALSQDLMKVSSLLAKGKGGSGNKLNDLSHRELMGFSSRLQLTLIASELGPPRQIYLAC
jgi:hypothetical protein